MILIISSSTIKIIGGAFKVWELIILYAGIFPNVGDFYPTNIFFYVFYLNLSIISF